MVQFMFRSENFGLTDLTQRPGGKQAGVCPSQGRGKVMSSNGMTFSNNNNSDDTSSDAVITV